MPVREERISSSSLEAPSEQSISVIHGRAGGPTDVSLIGEEMCSGRSVLGDISNVTTGRSRSVGRRMRVYPGQPKEGPSAARRIDSNHPVPPREPRSRSVCGYTSRVRVGGDKENENEAQESSSSGIFSCRRPPGMAALARRNEAEIIAAAPFQPSSSAVGRFRRGGYRHREEERHVAVLEAELERYRQMVDLLREKERIREEMVDEEVQTEDALVFSDDYGRVVTEKVDSCPLLLPPLCVQVRDLEKALIERTREWSERKLGMETELHDLRQEKHLNDMRIEELERETAHKINKAQQELKFARIENIQLRMQVQEASRLGDEEFRKLKGEVIRLRGEVEEMGSELKLARMVTVEIPKGEEVKEGRLELSLL